MVRKFNEDLAAAKEAERLVEMYFRVLGSEAYDFRNVSEDSNYYHKGDILALDSTGREIGIEVKDDSRIGDTGNVLCEEQVYYFDSNYYAKGNMYSDYDIYCIVSKQENKIHILDFKKLKEIYKKFGIGKEMPHEDQASFCYLVPLWVVKKQGAYIGEIDYSGDSPVAKVYNAFEEEAKRIKQRLENNRKWRELVSSSLFAALR